MSYESSLSAIGLNVNESKLYLFMLHNGACAAPQLQAALGIDKVPTYRALNELKSRGYVKTIGSTRNQQFVAAPIGTVLKDYDEKMNSLVSARSDFENLVKDLADKQASLYKENHIRVYEGIDGYKLWMEARLQDGVTLVREFGQNIFLEPFFSSITELESFTHDYIARRVSKGIAMRSLGDERLLRDYDASSKRLLKEQRFIETGDDMMALVSIFGDCFGFYTKQGEKYLGVIIEDRLLAKIMAMSFDALWQTASDKRAN